MKKLLFLSLFFVLSTAGFTQYHKSGAGPKKFIYNRRTDKTSGTNNTISAFGTAGTKRKSTFGDFEMSGSEQKTSLYNNESSPNNISFDAQNDHKKTGFLKTNHSSPVYLRYTTTKPDFTPSLLTERPVSNSLIIQKHSRSKSSLPSSLSVPVQ